MDKCPHIIRKSAGDESYDLCELTERPSGRIKPCSLESGSDCEIWDDVQEGRMKDKEAQEKLNLHFASTLVPNNIRDAWGATNLTQRLQVGQAIVDLLQELGYRKLPKDKPPLISEDEIRERLGIVYDTVAPDRIWNAKVGSFAQREADIKHYE